MKITIEQIASVCHDTNASYCRSIGDTTQKNWTEAEQWQKDSAVKGVAYKIENPSATPEEQHNAWLEAKRKDGWAYGDVKDSEKKLHPCFVPYEELPMEQQAKDYLFQGVVNALSNFL